MGTQYNNHKKYDLLFQWAAKQIEIQSGAIDSLENKAGALLAAVGIVLTILASILISPDGKYDLNVSLLIGVGLAGIGSMLSLLVLMAKGMKASPDIGKFHGSFWAANDDEYWENFLARMHGAIRMNSVSIEAKGRLHNLAMVVYGMATAFIIVGLFVQKYHREVF